MTNNTSQSGGEVEAREAAIEAAIVSLREYKLMGGTFGDTAARVAIPAALDAYLAKLTSTKAKPGQIAEIREQHARDEATFTKHPSISGSLERWLRSTHEVLGKALDHITAIEADRCLSCGVKPGKINCDPGTSNVELRQKIESLQSERDRMTKALEEIVGMTYAGAPDIYMKRIARAALAPPSTSQSEGEG